MASGKKTRRQFRPSLALVAGLLAVIVVVGLVWASHRSKHVEATATPTPSAAAVTTADSSGDNVSGTAVSRAGSTVTPTPSTTATSSVTAPPVPTGDLLNVHTVSLSSGSTSLESTCQTLAGYTCGVQATNQANGQVVLSSTVTADSNGDAIIDWKATTLSVGTWTIKLVTTNAGKSTTSQLSDTLQVSS